MSIQLFSNNASSLLASGINNVVSTLSLTPGTGALFPSPGAGQIAVVTIEDTLGVIEICWCTGRSGDTLTVTRGQEGTTAVAMASGSRVELRVTAGILNQMLQKVGGDTLTGVTSLSGTLALGSSGSITGGEFTGKHRSAAGVTGGEISVSGGQPFSGANAILTSANITTNLPAGYALIVTNMVVLWYGTSATVPAGWHICDGAAGTPNLQDKFVIGAGGALSPTSGGGASSGGSTTVNLAGGTVSGSTTSYVLTVADIPAHHHSVALQTLAVGVGSGPVVYVGGVGLQTGDTGGGGGHSHTLSGATLSGSVAYLPPYTGLFYIMKT